MTIHIAWLLKIYLGVKGRNCVSLWHIMASASGDTQKQVYNLREEETLSSRVALVVCVMVQRGLYIAGFSITKELLTIHYSGYGKNRPVWSLDFFEQSFSSEPLLAVKEKVKGVFISSQRHIIVPDEIYEESSARNWLAAIHFVEHGDKVMIETLEHDKAHLMQAVPLNITELVRINFKKAAVAPLHTYQFVTKHAQSLQLQCCISNEQVTFTLHNYSQLLWHHVMDYVNADDIAYMVRLHCKENYIDPAKLNIACDTLTAAEYEVVRALSQYFPTLKCGNGLTIHNSWDPAICLANQLLECAL